MESRQPTRRSLLKGSMTAPWLTGAALTPAAHAAADHPAARATAVSAPTWGGQQVALFLSAHQDDELLQMGSQIRADLLAGHRVVVVNCVDGRASGARTASLARHLGYTPTVEEFVAVRDAEFLESTARLGVPARQRVIESQRLVDGRSTLEGAQRILTSWLARHPGALVRTHSWLDPHPDHANLGRAVAAAVDAGTVGPAQDARFFVPHPYADLPGTPPLQPVTEPVGGVEQTPYRDHDPAHDRWGVGYHSTPAYFDAHRADPTSWFHRRPRRLTASTTSSTLPHLPEGFSC